MKTSPIFSVPLLLAVVTCDANVIPTPAKAFLHDASTLIVGGRPALQVEAPYQLDLRLLPNNIHYCGASLVEVEGLQIALSASHCIIGTEVPYDLVAGDINLEDRTGIEQILHVSKIVVHPNYTRGWDLSNDIAVLFFNGSFTTNENVQTIPLPTQGQVTNQGNLTVSGWGNLEYNGGSPQDLQIVEIPLVNDSYCQEAYKDYPSKATDDMICAGVPTGDLSPCHGDSGGPAISDAGYLAGIVSWGYECGHPDYPGVFTKVSHYVDWIHDTVGGYKRSM